MSDDEDPELRALAHEVLAAARAAGVDVVLEDLGGAGRTGRSDHTSTRRERAGAP